MAEVRDMWGSGAALFASTHPTFVAGYVRMFVIIVPVLGQNGRHFLVRYMYKKTKRCLRRVMHYSPKGEQKRVISTRRVNGELLAASLVIPLARGSLECCDQYAACAAFPWGLSRPLRSGRSAVVGID